MRVVDGEQKEKTFPSAEEFLRHILEIGKEGVNIQRYKGLEK